MKLIPNSNNIARITGILGVKKTTEYFFIGTGFALVALGSVCYLITAIKSHGRIKEQNDVFANKQREIEIASLCKMQENEQLDDSLTVLEFVRSIGEYVTTADGKATASQMCEKFLFTPKQQWTPISKLSGGEKRRLYLLSVLMSAPNVLILDEPTNDLDIETLEILEEYLDGFAGIVITVSHDRYFLDRVVDRIFAFEAGGHLTQYEGGYTDYRDKCVSSIYNVASNGTSDTSKSKAAGQVKKAYNSHEDKIKFTYMEQKEYETIDDDIEELENRVSELDDEIAKNATSYSKLAELTKEKEEVERRLEEKMERWEYLNDLAEKIEKQKQ